MWQREQQEVLRRQQGGGTVRWMTHRWPDSASAVKASYWAPKRLTADVGRMYGCAKGRAGPDHGDGNYACTPSSGCCLSLASRCALMRVSARWWILSRTLGVSICVRARRRRSVFGVKEAAIDSAQRGRRRLLTRLYHGDSMVSTVSRRLLAVPAAGPAPPHALRAETRRAFNVHVSLSSTLKCCQSNLTS